MISESDPRGGRLPATQLGGRKAGWRIAQEDLQDFLDDGKERIVAGTRRDERDLANFDDAQRDELALFQEGQRQRRDTFISDQDERRQSSGHT